MNQNEFDLLNLYRAHALSNPAICTGTAPSYDLQRWFGKNASGITRAQIIAVQAEEAARALLEMGMP